MDLTDRDSELSDGKVVGALANVRRALGRLRIWQVIVTVLVVIFMIAIVRPLTTTPELAAPDVAKAWNDAIARLGILPVFPPEEDFHVGDVWAVVADTEHTPLLGKAVRVAHLDLRQDIKEAKDRRPVFAETVAVKEGEKFRRQDNREAAGSEVRDGRIALTLAAFPGITVNHTTRAAGSISAGLFGLGSTRDDLKHEEIRIPVAETYGVPMLSGFGKLDDWCADESTKIYCTDAFVRRLLAFAVSERVLATRDGQYIARLQLRLVTRVFLTREIEHRKRQGQASGATLSTPTDPPQSTPVAGAAPNNAITQTTSAAAQPQSAPGATTNASASRSDGTEIYLQQVFQRPVVIGYRAITIALPPAQPSAGTQP